MSIDIEITKTKSKVCRNYIGPSFIVSSLLSSLLTVIEMKARHSGSIRNSKSARLIFANFDDKEIQYIIHFKCGILSFFPPLIGCQGHSMQNVALKRSVGSGVCVCVPISPPGTGRWSPGWTPLGEERVRTKLYCPILFIMFLLLFNPLRKCLSDLLKGDNVRRWHLV